MSPLHHAPEPQRHERIGDEITSREAFRPPSDGTTNWPALREAFDVTGSQGYLTFEYLHPDAHWPQALIYQTADSLDRVLG